MLCCRFIFIFILFLLSLLAKKNWIWKGGGILVLNWLCENINLTMGFVCYYNTATNL